MNSRISPSHRCLGGFTAAAAAAIAISAGCAPGSSAFNAPTISRPASTYDSKLRPRGIAYKYFQLTGLGIGSARDIALGHDGNLWISTDSQCTIERLTPTGVATAYSYGNVSGCSQSTSITPGPDGKLWFIDRTANIVGKISTKGAIKTYPLPAASPCNYYPSQPLGIVAGPDGAMWFTVTYPGSPFCSGHAGLTPAVGRITTSGAMTFYYTAPEGTTNATEPERITAGPDGNLYFTANVFGGSKDFAVGTLTTGGAFTYTLPFSGAANFDDYLTFGADGNLWVTDNGGNHNIFRIAGGVATPFTVGTYNGVQEAAYGITSGPDNQLWFTTFDDNVLGQITTAGQITLYPAPSCAPANSCGGGGGIVTRGKAVWYTLPGNHEDEDIAKAGNLP